METGPLKSFATWARTELIKEVGARMAAVLSPGSSERVEDPAAIRALESAIKAGGGDAAGRAKVADKVAYIWFNRIVALRFMDANGYTGVGVVSPHPGQTSGQPEVLADAKRGVIDSEVVGKRTAEAITALLDGTRRSTDAHGEAFSLLLAEYCRHWHRSMPFMFEREGDYTELLIPANLLADDSVLARAARVLTPEVCQDVEVIGWLYQFYISERKDEVFAGFKRNKKAGADEIPAATQLFTPHWIVRYLVENSLGRLWMRNHPASRLVDQMDYYIAPVDEGIGSLKITRPEELTVIDPACGSGHMLTYAFDLLYAIYEEQGYASSDIPGLILTRNLYGLEIDPRAGALAAFALTMKARAKQRTFFSKQVEPNICVLDPITFSPDELGFLVTKDGDRRAEEAFWNQFAEADTVGSLIRPNPGLTSRLAAHLATLDDEGDLLRADVLEWGRRVIERAECLSSGYSIVVANPPYMGNASMGALLADFAKVTYPSAKTDLFAMFIQRSLALAVPCGVVGMVTMHSWMFLKSYRAFRDGLLRGSEPVAFAHLGTRAFAELGGEVVSTVAFVLTKGRQQEAARAPFERLVDLPNSGAKAKALREAAVTDTTRTFRRSWSDLAQVPDRVLSYWLPDAYIRILASQAPLAARVPIMAGISTGDNGKYFRYWPEVSASRIRGGEIQRPWAPHHKGGPERRWAGNVLHVLRYDSQSVSEMKLLPGFRHDGNASYFKAHVGWSALTSGAPSFRFIDEGHTFGSGSKALVASRADMLRALGVLNSVLAAELLEGMSPTLNFEVGHIGLLPTIPQTAATTLDGFVEQAIDLAQAEWNESELALGFAHSPVVRLGSRLSDAVDLYRGGVVARARQVAELESQIEVEVRRVFDVDMNEGARARLSQIADPPPRSEIVRDLVSYSVGCMFGRYSLDIPGLVLADQGATLQDYLAKAPSPSFMPDADNVIPIVDGDWFEDDIVERFRRFLRVAFGEQHFEANLSFIAESLGVRSLRDYFVKSFFRDHVQRYRKRPIYWLFSSPKGSFNALIYMHRYTPSTVSTVLNEYLREFQAKLQASLAQAEGSSNSREADRLRSVLVELNEYEHDVLYPLASRQLAIDLDDGVKANYPKLGAALKKIPGLEAGDE